MTLVVVAAVLFLAWSNGSNDNFKGVATLYGSGTTTYRKALAWATVTTLAGSLMTLLLAAALVKTFSARGLVADAIAVSPSFLAAVALGAGVTVLLASLFGLPVSTTHALTGALVGAGLASGAAVRFAALGKSFFLPLLVSPLVAVALTALTYPIVSFARRRLGVDKSSCVCVGEELVAVGNGGAAGAAARISVKAAANCDRYEGRIAGLSAQQALDGLHFLSAGAVSFARGLNDTPKIFALLLATRALSPSLGLAAVGVMMALGGIAGARKVAETMSKKIVPLNTGQGFVANAATAFLVIGASRWGVPVSTTHVSTGGILGIGLNTRQARWKTVVAILTAWGTTLPLGAALGALSFLILR
jgi:PiT family inorganic phosphate transporter